MQTVCNTYWVAGKGNLTVQNTRKPFGGQGSAPDAVEGAYSAPANPPPLVGREGLSVSSPRTTSPALGPLGLASPTPTPKLVPTPLILQLRLIALKTAPQVTCDAVTCDYWWSDIVVANCHHLYYNWWPSFNLCFIYCAAMCRQSQHAPHSAGVDNYWHSLPL